MSQRSIPTDVGMVCATRSRAAIIIVFVVVASLGLTVNLLVAIGATQDQSGAPRSERSAFAGPDVELRWPVTPPGSRAWPSPAWVVEDRTRTMRFIMASAHDDTRTSHSMMVYRYGWPFPVLQRVDLRWPFDEPEWAIDAPSDSGLRIRWDGLLLPPIGLAVLVTGALVALSAALTRRRPPGRAPRET